jgi:hypothetical protein
VWLPEGPGALARTGRTPHREFAQYWSPAEGATEFIESDGIDTDTDDGAD